jgi:YVTN family beta-propeller protein
MGVVYRAEHLTLRRSVALKLVAPELATDPRFRERFLAESRLATSLEHESVIPIYDAGEADGQLYLAMRLVEGESLSELLATEAPLAPARTIALLAPVASALDAAHARGLVHRDVKPANILLEAEDEKEHVYLSDFGLARLAGEARPDEMSHLSGSLHYVAPEQVTERAVDPRVDVYALGCVLHECLTGEPPYRETSPMTLLWAHAQEPPPKASERNPQLPKAIDPVIARALAKEPKERQPTCGELIADAARALGVRLAPTRRRRLLRAATIVALVAVAALAATLALTLGNGTPQTAKPTTIITRDTLQRIDPETNKLVATIPYGREGVAEHRDIGWARGAFAVGEGAVWVFGAGAQTILRIDPKTNTVAGQSAVSLDPNAATEAGLVAGLGHVWVATGTSAITVIDPRTGLTTGQVDIPGNQYCPDVQIQYGRVLTDCGNKPKPPVDVVTWWRIDPKTMTAVAATGPQPDAPAGDVGWNGTWTEPGWDMVISDMATGKRVASFHLPFDFAGWDAWDSSRPWADGNTNGWFANPEADTVWEVDSHTGDVVAKISVGHDPGGVLRSDGAVWVANSGDGTVSRIDPATGEVVATIEVGGSPQSVQVGEGGVWVSVYPI